MAGFSRTHYPEFISSFLSGNVEKSRQLMMAVSSWPVFAMGMKYSTVRM